MLHYVSLGLTRDSTDNNRNNFNTACCIMHMVGGDGYLCLAHPNHSDLQLHLAHPEPLTHRLPAWERVHLDGLQWTTRPVQSNNLVF